jgi:hypothetical protein
MKRYKYGLARKDGTYTILDYDIPDVVDPYSFVRDLRDVTKDPNVIGVFLVDPDVPCWTKKTSGVKVPVYDVVRTRKMVELPEKCPNCECEVIGHPLLVWEHQDQSRTAVVNGEGDVEWKDDLRSGECSYEVAWLCGSCDHPLVEGEERMEVEQCEES